MQYAFGALSYHYQARIHISDQIMKYDFFLLFIWVNKIFDRVIVTGKTLQKTDTLYVSSRLQPLLCHTVLGLTVFTSYGK